MTVRITVAIIFLAFSVAACATDNKNPPNIVLIISDYMGYHDIQPYGATDIQTPSLSRLAAEGVTMTDFHAAAPVCGPSRAALPPNQPPGLSESQWDEGWDVDTATRQDYVQMVERMDEGIGQVLDKLDTLGIDENTLVIYLYDHGGRNLVNSEPLFHGFATLWEGGIRIPMVVRWPAMIYC